MNRLSVIIPSRTLSNLTPCVEAVRRHEPDVTIRVVWDRSKGNRDLVSCVHVDSVYGVTELFNFSHNVNIGINASGSDDILLLNDDALLNSPFGFSLMQQAAEDYPEFGLIGATCNNVGNPNQFRSNIGLRVDPRMVCFVAVLIPRRTIETVGLLDERFTGYGMEDDDLCLRVRQAGLKIGIHDGCYVDHGSLRSSFRGKAGAGGDFKPNLRKFIEKHGVDNWGHTKNRSQFKELFPA